MALVRTFINRGKRALELSELKPNGVYAVHHIIPIEVAEEWGVPQQEQWGIIQLGASKEVRRSYNVVTPGSWSKDEVSLCKLKIYRASMMEQQYAYASEEEHNLTIKCRQMAARCQDLNRRLTYIEDNRWYRIAAKIDKLFS